MCYFVFFFFKQKTAYEMRISDWSSDVCSSDLQVVLSHDDGQHAAHEVVGNFIDLGEAMLRQPGALAGRDNGGIERVLDAGLEGCIEKSKVSDLVRSLAFGLQHLAPQEIPFGPRARIVGAQAVPSLRTSVERG